jgi:hypothetical protein
MTRYVLFSMIILVVATTVLGCGIPGTWLVTPTSTSANLTSTPSVQISPLDPSASDAITRRSNDGWLAWTESTDLLVLAKQWTQILYVRQGEDGRTTTWRVSEDIRQAYFLPVDWVPGTHLILARKGAVCNSCWSWGLPLVTINADTGKIIELDVATLPSPEAYAFNPKQPGIIVIANGGSRYLLDGMRLTLLDLTTGKKRDLTDASMTAFEPAWSPDGTWIAYAAVRAVQNATGDGPTLERLLNFADHTDIRVVSLDGKTDEWLATRTITPMCNYGGCGWETILKYP